MIQDSEKFGPLVEVAQLLATDLRPNPNGYYSQLCAHSGILLPSLQTQVTF